MKPIYTLLFILLMTVPAFAQLVFDGVIRPRVEYRDGFIQIPTKEATPAFFISQQTRLGLKFTEEDLQGKFTLQDARIWGGDNGLSLYEAWAKYQIYDNFAVKFGRQELHYDDGRLISKRPRRQDGFNYDALLFQYAKDSLFVDLGFSVNNSQANRVGNNYAFAASKFKAFHFLYLKKYFDNGLDIAGTAILSGFQKENTDTVFYKQTIGTKIDYRKNDFSTSFEGFYQTGKHKDGRSVNSYLLTGKVGFDFSRKLKLTVGTEIVSGHRVQNSNTDYQNTLHNFDILEGARFRYFGRMNYFRNLETDTGGGGLIDYYTKARFKFNNKFQVIVAYHYFDTQQFIFDANTDFLNQHLASEIDMMLKYQPKKNVQCSLGYSFLNPTNTLEFIQDIPMNEGQNAHYLWVMVATKFEYAR